MMKICVRFPSYDIDLIMFPAIKMDYVKTILVIEDEEDLAEILQDELSELGYHVVTAANGMEGLEKIQEYEPDLVICDRVMPQMSGHQLLERLRGVYPQYGGVPFIFLSALTEESHVRAVEDLNPAAYLKKPVDFDLLHKVVTSALQ